MPIVPSFSRTALMALRSASISSMIALATPLVTLKSGYSFQSSVLTFSSHSPSLAYEPRSWSKCQAYQALIISRNIARSVIGAPTVDIWTAAWRTFGLLCLASSELRAVPEDRFGRVRIAAPAPWRVGSSDRIQSSANSPTAKHSSGLIAAPAISPPANVRTLVALPSDNRNRLSGCWVLTWNRSASEIWVDFSTIGLTRSKRCLLSLTESVSITFTAAASALPLFDPLLGCPSTIVETHHSFGARRHVRDDEAHPREQLSPMPLHLRHHPPNTVPTLSTIPEVVV